MTNGSSFDKNLTSSDAETLKDKEKERTDVKASPTDAAKDIKKGADTKVATTTAKSSAVKKDTKAAISNPKYKKPANTARVGK